MLSDTRILLVEDDPYVALICTDVLSAFGASVAVTSTVAEAAAVAAAFTPDAIVCDVGLPDGSVDDLRDLVSDVLEAPSAPFFVMSGTDHSDRYREPEVAGFFLKPVRVSSIATAIAERLAR
jgi:DNA-binding response OmpR family regulator